MPYKNTCTGCENRVHKLIFENLQLDISAFKSLIQTYTNFDEMFTMLETDQRKEIYVCQKYLNYQYLLLYNVNYLCIYYTLLPTYILHIKI